MSDLLYRWTNQSNGAWVDTESMRQELVADGVLVPVEPDEVLELDEGAYTRVTGPSRVLIFLGEGWNALGETDG